MGRWGDGEILIKRDLRGLGGFPHERLHQDRVIIRLHHFLISYDIAFFIAMRYTEFFP